jgi:hypothetical protein
MNYFLFFIFLFFYFFWGGETNCSLEQGKWDAMRNPRVQMATGHDILVMFEREYYNPLWCHVATGGNWSKLTRCVYATLIVASLLRWLVPCPGGLVQPIKKHQESLFYFIFRFFFYKKSKKIFYFYFLRFFCYKKASRIFIFLFLDFFL